MAATAPHSFYAAEMGQSWSYGGIMRDGSSGNHTDSVIAGREDMPVNWVSWHDSLRFANWLHNGQPSGAQDASTTEDGAYDMSLEAGVVRKPNAKAFLPNADEWYKAAYYDADLESYFDQPAGSDTESTCAGPGAAENTANCNESVGDLIEVGGYTSSNSPAETFDPGGNAWEWNETPIEEHRDVRGGSFRFGSHGSASLAASLRLSTEPLNYPPNEHNQLGFRVAKVPDPAEALLYAGGLAMLVLLRRRRISLGRR